MSMMVIAAGLVAVAVGCNKKDAATAKESAMTPSAGTLSAPAKDATAEASMPAMAVPAQPARDPATVLVTVNGTTLTVGEVEKQLAPMMAQMGGDPRMAAMKDRFYQQVVDRFVIRTVLAAEADRLKIAVTPADVDEAVSMITNRLPAGLTLEAALARDGISTEQFRSNLTAELRIKDYVESQVPTNVAVSDQEIADFYAQEKERFAVPETVTARHILLKVDKGVTDQVRGEKKAKAEALRKQLVEGADFAALARENSDCPSKERGGDLGSFGRGQMVKPFEEAAFSQATNAVGPVVETDFGYHIIQVTDRHAAGTTSLEEVKDRLTDHLKQKKQMAAFDTLMTSLKGKATITYDDSVKPQPRGEGVMGMPDMGDEQ
jgi:peptidyl-prolyl cis-trans isomerase C